VNRNRAGAKILSEAIGGDVVPRRTIVRFTWSTTAGRMSGLEPCH
jgi:hypothetical protein